MLQGRNDRAGRLLKEIKRVRGEIKQLEEARQAGAGTLAYRGESLAGQKVGSAKAKSAGTETKTIGTEAEAAGTGVKTVGTEAKAFGAEAKLPAGVLPAAAREIAQVAKPSGFRIVGGFLAREAPGLIVQVALMSVFPPEVNIHNDKGEQLYRSNVDPAVRAALAKQAPMVDKLLAGDLSQGIYANVKVRLDYQLDASSHGDAEIYLQDVTFLDMKITNEDVKINPKKISSNSPRARHKAGHVFTPSLRA